MNLVWWLTLHWLKISLTQFFVITRVTLYVIQNSNFSSKKGPLYCEGVKTFLRFENNRFPPLWAFRCHTVTVVSMSKCKLGSKTAWINSWRFSRLDLLHIRLFLLLWLISCYYHVWVSWRLRPVLVHVLLLVRLVMSSLNGLNTSAGMLFLGHSTLLPKASLSQFVLDNLRERRNYSISS